MIFIEGGRLFINEGGAITEHLSPFARDKVADEEKAQQKNAWKNEAPDDPHNPMFSRQVLWGGKGGGTKAVPPRFVLAQVVGRRLYYVLSMSRSHGLFYFDRDAGSEVRLFHKEEFQPRGLYVDAIGRVYTTRTNADHSTHIIRFDEDGKNIKVLTAGDCCDENPYLVGSRLYYQSAGIGRTEQGQAAAWAPIAIHCIDVERGDLTTIAENPAHDYLLPKADRAGNIYYIRRPHQQVADYPWSTFLWDIFAFPYRLVMGIVGFLDAFTRFFGNQGIRTAGGPTGTDAGLTHRVILGQWMDVVAATKKAGRPVAVPGDWVLLKRAPDGAEQVVAQHVIWYDLAADGGIVYTNGFEVTTTSGGSQHRSDELISLLAMAGPAPVRNDPTGETP